jgi:hypothetical protein
LDSQVSRAVQHEERIGTRSSLEGKEVFVEKLERRKMRGLPVVLLELEIGRIRGHSK